MGERSSSPASASSDARRGASAGVCGESPSTSPRPPPKSCEPTIITDSGARRRSSPPERPATRSWSSASSPTWSRTPSVTTFRAAGSTSSRTPPRDAPLHDREHRTGDPVRRAQPPLPTVPATALSRRLRCRRGRARPRDRASDRRRPRSHRDRASPEPAAASESTWLSPLSIERNRTSCVAAVHSSSPPSSRLPRPRCSRLRRWLEPRRREPVSSSTSTSSSSSGGAPTQAQLQRSSRTPSGSPTACARTGCPTSPTRPPLLAPSSKRSTRASRSRPRSSRRIRPAGTCCRAAASQARARRPVERRSPRCWRSPAACAATGSRASPTRAAAAS